MRKADVDPAALAAFIDRAFGGARVSWQRTPDGVSTQVYRLETEGPPGVSYLRIAEEPDHDMAPEVEVHGRLAAAGVRVPEILHYEPFDQRLGRSVAITSEIPGSSLLDLPDVGQARRVARAAGRDLAVINRVSVDGFGWVSRRPPGWPLRGELPNYAEFARRGVVPDAAATADAGLLSPDELEAVVEIAAHEAQRPLPAGALAHGDFDVTAIFQLDGGYSGIIDFGEMRGTEPLYDLGHFALRDGTALPTRLLPDLVAGYRQVSPLPDDVGEVLRRSAILGGIRQLSRWLRRWGPQAPEVPVVAQLAGRVRRLVGSAPSVTGPREEDAA